ncbi:tricorn protease [Catalinimonas alkaloidigena]|uniref:S41 family peptidase n=1 Tax=Catalinimonas alkaloidigena TaxID=1075417 RepID=UPI002405AA6E|nr:S41 family peptidase [Catalinimonas alkaloidigena]MDF9795038.1 tricorn protease [Catalinimonas alkaloidigena]
MTQPKPLFKLAMLFLALCTSKEILAQESRLLRNPAISNEHISFAYAGDIWLADTDGFNVRRLTTFPGVESEPHFSPDGQQIAFTGEYDGNTDVFVVPVAGGSPQRLTWHPEDDFVRGWTKDSEVLFASGRTRVPYPLPDQLWTVKTDGSMPEQFIVPRAVNGKFSPNGDQFVYEMIFPWESEFRNYRGGQLTPLRIMDLQSYDVKKLPWDNSRDIDPVWMGDKVYFLSDRAQVMNIWEYDTQSRAVKQLSFFEKFDCKNLEGGNATLIFENGGYLHTLNPEGGEPEKLSIEVVGDFPWARPHWSKIEDYVDHLSISPTGKRVAISARGDVFTVPADKGSVRNLTNTSGVADRQVAWSPDGKYISWFSDEGGEYQLVISGQYGKEKRKIEIEHPTFYYHPTWSPDSKYLSFYNENRTLMIVEVESGALTEVDNEGFAHPQHVIYGEWAPDSKWLAYTKRLSNEYAAIFVYSLDQQKSFQLTDGMADCQMPAWDASGKYIYFTASTDYGLNVGWLDMSSYDHPVNRAIYLAVLSKDEPSPLSPESDDEPVGEEEKEEKEEAEKDKKKKSEEGEDQAEEKKVEVKIDFEELQQRVVALPVPVRSYTQLEAAKEGVILYTEQVPQQDGLSLHRFSLEKREPEKITDGVQGFEISADKNKYLYMASGKQYILSDPYGKPDPGEEKLDISNVKIKVDPAKEWQQIFREAWRYQRDYFYVDNVHGLDLDWAYETYAPWIEDVKHRSDLNYVLDIFGGETSIGHSFVGGGDYPDVDRVPLGLLGADYTIENNRYRIQKIYSGESWNPQIKAPLSAPSSNVNEGDYLLAVNGVELDASQNLFSAFDQTADQQIFITVNSTPSMEGARELTVVPVSNEHLLRQYDWVEGNRRKVDELSDGQLAYVWLPNTGGGGYANFNRYYFAQKDKKGAVIDERFNQGGSIADYIVDLLARDLLGYFNNPIGDRQPFTAPNGGIWGPKVMVINEMAGSGGDMMPYMFKMRDIGPLVGTKTWGGLVGIWDVPQLIDNGRITAPRGGFYNLEGEWDVENIGVAPDIEVEQGVRSVIEGHDPQLEKAVEVALELLEENPVELLPQPEDPVRVVQPSSER